MRGTDDDADAWPSEIRLSADKRSLAVTFPDGAFELPSELLRVESPSAEVQGHGPSEKRTVPGKRDVCIVAVEPVGNYAVRLRFDDGHATGIFGWRYLRDLGRRRDAAMAAYLERLERNGLSRDPPPGRR